ncbi:hypothetical protein G9A89_007882 [Geosiphon pyriformis]|nr:hypothetical protein G9A89_007882 [Geosiphon pyriformis]
MWQLGDDTFKVGLPKCLECYSALKDPVWCKSCESSRFLKIWGTWNSGNDNIDQYILYTQLSSENWRGCLEWISPDEIICLDQVGAGGFGIVKEGRWENGRILLWDNKIQKYERTGVTKVALKYLKDSQNIKYINSHEFIAHHQSATCKYILECYGITKDITTDEYVMVLPFVEHGDLRAFLKNETTLTWEMFLRILFQISSGLRFIHESELLQGDLHPGNILVLKTNPVKVVISDLGLCRPADYVLQCNDIFGVVEYLAPEVCNLSPHTRHSDIYSCAIISWEIISGKRPWNDEMIEKNWDDKSHCRDSAEELQQRVIDARYNCNLNESVWEKKLNSKEIQSAIYDTTRYKSQSISKPTFSTNGKLFIYYYLIGG